MFKRLFIILFYYMFLNTVYAYELETVQDNDWSKLLEPTEHFSEPIGSYANGCLAGGQALPKRGKGFIDMRRHRIRFFGHADLITFILDLGDHIQTLHKRNLLIGDLSQARGGKMNFGHTSHRIGLDVDIWLQSFPQNKMPDPMLDMQTIVDKASGKLLTKKLSPVMRDALYYSANYDQVARIFVNPIIKAQLCESEKKTGWLHKLRPWWGHDQHFHVRLRCPEGALHCVNQTVIPLGDGCNDNLLQWVQEQSDIVTGRKKKNKNKSKVKSKPRTPPSTCDAIRLYSPPKKAK